jgi:hypothetical protein
MALAALSTSIIMARWKCATAPAKASMRSRAPGSIQRVDVERFISLARNEPPDIEVDIEHERREVVIQDVYTNTGATAPVSLRL